MKTNFKYLTILFLLLSMGSCRTIQHWVCGSGYNPNPPLPDAVLCTRDAKVLEENYITLKGFTAQGKGATHDNREVSFTHEHIMQCVEYLFAKARALNYDDDEIGIRVFLGAKPEGTHTKGEIPKMTEGQKGYTTVFFVATKKGASADPSDYEIIYEIPALNYGGSRRPPKRYDSPLICPVHNVKH